MNASGGEYPTLRAGGRSLPSPLTMRVRVEKRQAPPPKAKGSAGLDERGAGLYTRLRLLRGKLAAEQGVPAFVVFSDATLRDALSTTSTVKSSSVPTSATRTLRWAIF